MTEAMITQWIFFAVCTALIVFLSYRAWMIYQSRKKKDKGDDDKDEQ